MSKLISDEQFWGGVITRLSDHNQLEFEMCDDDIADQEAIEQIVIGALDQAASVLAAKIAAGEETAEINISERITLVCSVRTAEEGDKNMSLSAIIGPELKKKVKDDAGLTD